jgi:hypothetical protein
LVYSGRTAAGGVGGGDEEIVGGVDAGRFPYPIARTIIERVDTAEIDVVIRAEVDAWVGGPDGEAEEAQTVENKRTRAREQVMAAGVRGQNVSSDRGGANAAVP